MIEAISLPRAASLALSRLKSPIVTGYQLGLLVFGLYRAGGIDGKRLEVRKPWPERRHFLEVRGFLTEHGMIQPVRGFPEGGLYTLPGGADISAHALLCSADPFAYLSHLSAMALHGLTDRIPRMIFASSPAPRQWHGFAEEQMRKDLAEELQIYLDAGFPPLRRSTFEKILGQPVHLAQSSHLGAFKKLEPHGIRVSTLGRTFLDMLRDADLCGGIQHVIDTYKAHAAEYLQLIIAEVEQHGNDIDKVRAGYVLEEQCSLSDPVFAHWQRHAKRGGSRKLVPNQPYSSTYSEKWCLSLNAD
jgi:predicted transcriptional regulator of viral defense system